MSDCHSSKIRIKIYFQNYSARTGGKEHGIVCTLLVIVCAVPYPYGEGESILRHILAHVS